MTNFPSKKLGRKSKFSLPQDCVIQELEFSWDPRTRRNVVTQAEANGEEWPVQWRLMWSPEAEQWLDEYMVPGGPWRRTTHHDLLPKTAEDFYLATEVCKVIARRFARSFEVQDGRGRFSELAKAAQELKLL
jgi:hypothetical protein